MNKAGRPRDPESIESMGRAIIMVDKTCRQDLRKLADANNLTLVKYLRKIAEQETERGKQKIFPGYDLPGKKRSPELEAVRSEINPIILFVSDRVNQLGYERMNIRQPVSDAVQRKIAELVEVMKRENSQLQLGEQVH